MDTGLLWFDDAANRPLTDKVEDAARRYREKFGAPPDTCYVNRAALNGDAGLAVAVQAAPGITLRVLPAANIPPSHFWIGVETAAEDRREDRAAA